MPSLTQEIAQDPDLRWEWIRYQLNVDGTSLADVAKEHGIDRRNLYKARRDPFPRVEKILADAVGVTPQELFPDRYNRHGLPARRQPSPRTLCRLMSPKHTGAAANPQSPEVSS